MNRFSRMAALAALALGIAGSAAAQDYYGDIRPIIEDTCVGCHSCSASVAPCPIDWRP